MDKDLINLMNEFGQKAFDVARRVGEVNLRTGERLLEQQMQLTTAWLGLGSGNMELLGQAKTYQDVLAGQAKLAQEVGQQYLDGCRGTAEIFAQARQAMTEVADESMEQMKAAGETLTKASVRKAA